MTQQQQSAITPENTPLSSLWKLTTPAELSAREMQNQYTLRPRQDVGFIDKIGLAFANETVTGEVWRSITAPDYTDTNYVATDEDIEKYASDLPREMVDRAAAKVSSFSEFLYETDEIRRTNKRRAELFSGGLSGAAAGLGLTLLAAGGEAVLLTALASAIGGPAGGAAGVGNAISKATRIRGTLKGLGMAVAIDTPLEIARYNLDNTMRPRDAIIAIGAAAGIGGSLGAWKPHLFLGHAKNMAKTAELQEAADAARAAGKSDVADSIEATIKQKVKVRPVAEVHGEIATLKRPALMVRAKELEIEIMRVNEAGKKVQKKNAQLRQEIFEKTREAEGADTLSIARQVNRDLEGTNATQRADYARDLGVPESVIKKGGSTLRKATHRQAQEVAKTGKVRTGVIPKLPKGLRLNKSAVFKKVKIKFKSNVEAALWVIGKGGAKNAAKIKELKSWLKGSGIDDVDALAKQFVKDAEDMAGKGKSVEDISKLSRKELFRRAEEAGLDVRRDVTAAGGTRKLLKSADVVRKELAAHLKAKETPVDIDVRGMGVGSTKVRGGEVLEEGQGLFETRTSKGFEVDDVNPMSQRDDVIIKDADGNDIVTVDEGWSKFIDVDEDKLAKLEAGRYSVFGHNGGFREVLARLIDTLGGFENVPILGLFYKFTMPLQMRLLRYNSPLVRKYAAVFLEGGRSGGNNITTAAKINNDAVLTRVFTTILDAREAARKAGGKLDDLDIIRAVRSGESPDGPLGEAVKAVREFNNELLAHGQKGGIFTEAIPESASYFHRAYKSSAFSKLIEAHGRDEVIDFFKRAVLSKTPDIEEAKAKSLARRIVDYGMDPQAARDAKTGEIRIDYLRNKISEDFHGTEVKYADLDKAAKEEIDKFFDAVVPQIERQPHLSFGKRRISLDEGFEAKLGGEVVHIDTFFNNDVLGSLHRYAGRITGGVELRKGFKAVFGDADISTTDALTALRKAAIEAGDKDSAFVEWAFDHHYKSMSRLPIYTNPEAMKYIVGANSFSQATIGQTLGFAQIPEMASIVCRSGFSAAFSQFPALSDIAKIFSMGPRDFLTGRQGLGLQGLKRNEELNDLASVIETYVGVGGGDYKRGDHFMRRLDDMGFDDDLAKKAANKYLDYGRVTAGMSPLGIMPMDTFLRRWAGSASFQHFVNQAYKLNGAKPVLNRGFWKNSSVRFGELGLDADLIQRINKTLMDPNVVGVERGMFGGNKVKTIKMENVTDKYAMDQLFLAIRRHTDSMVQRQSFGESPAWMNTQMGKLFAQYRVFSFTAKTKQTAAGMARGDMIEAQNVVYGASLGALAYTLQTHYRAAGMSGVEKQMYLEERLTQERIIKAGAMKFGGSSIFPMLADSGSYLVGGKPIFDPSMRTTGLGIDPLRGSVPYSVLYGKVWPSVRELTGELFRDDPVSKQDLRQMQSLVWGLKLPGVDQGVNLLINKTDLRQAD